MRRLEYVRHIRSAPSVVHDGAEPALFLATILRERRRLEAERRTLLQRVARLEARLKNIGAAETRLVPMIKASPPAAGIQNCRHSTVPSRVPAGCSEFTLHY